MRLVLKWVVFWHSKTEYRANISLFRSGNDYSFDNMSLLYLSLNTKYLMRMTDGLRTLWQRTTSPTTMTRRRRTTAASCEWKDLWSADQIWRIRAFLMRFMRRSSFFIVRTRAMHFGLWIIAIFDVSDDLDAKKEKCEYMKMIVFLYLNWHEFGD